MFSLIMAIGGGVLDWLGGDHPAKAVIAGAATFAATMTLALLVLSFALPAGTTPPRKRKASRR